MATQWLLEVRITMVMVRIPDMFVSLIGTVVPGLSEAVILMARQLMTTVDIIQ